MKKRLILLAVILLCVATGCGTKTETAAVPAAETAVPAAQEEPAAEEPVKMDYSGFTGVYDDEYSLRAMMEATVEGDGLFLTISWSESAFAYYRWEMHAVAEGNRLVYSDCVSEYFASDDSPDGPEHTVLYTGGAGYFEVENGKLKWTGAEDQDCRECVFSKAA